MLNTNTYKSIHSRNIKQRKPYGGVGWKANKAYLQALLAFQPTPPYGFLCLMLLDVLFLWK